MNDKRVNGDILLLHQGGDGEQSTSCLPAEQYRNQGDHMRSKVLIAEINWQNLATAASTIANLLSQKYVEIEQFNVFPSSFI